MTPEQLYRYADRIRRRAEQGGRGSDYPQARRCARRFRTTIATVLEVVEEAKGLGLPIDVAVGVQNCAGYGCFDTEGDYEIETWPTQEKP